MYGNQWWGYQHVNGVVTISQQSPQFMLDRQTVKIVGPFTEDMADEFEGGQRMVRRRIMAAIFEKPLIEMLESE